MPFSVDRKFYIQIKLYFRFDEYGLGTKFCKVNRKESIDPLAEIQKYYRTGPLPVS